MLEQNFIISFITDLALREKQFQQIIARLLPPQTVCQAVGYVLPRFELAWKTKFGDILDFME